MRWSGERGSSSIESLMVPAPPSNRSPTPGRGSSTSPSCSCTGLVGSPSSFSSYKCSTTKSDFMSEGSDYIQPKIKHHLKIAQCLPSALVVARAIPRPQLLPSTGSIIYNHSSVLNNKFNFMSEVDKSTKKNKTINQQLPSAHPLCWQCSAQCPGCSFLGAGVLLFTTTPLG